MSTSESPVACTIPGPDGVQVPEEVCEPCCNCQNYEAEIQADARKSYYESTQVSSLLRQPVSFKVAIKLNPLENDKEIRVIIRIYPNLIEEKVKPHYDQFIKEYFIGSHKNKSIIEKKWSDKYKIRIRQMKKDTPSEDLCPPEELPVRFTVEIVDDPQRAHYFLKILHRDFPLEKPRANVNANIITLYHMEDMFELNHFMSRTDSDDPTENKYVYQQHDGTYHINEYVMSHEFGHLLGLPDEYPRANGVNATVKYIPPPGNPPAEIEVLPRIKSIMTNSVEHLYERHIYPIATEVKKILSEARGNEAITCEVIKR